MKILVKTLVAMGKAGRFLVCLVMTMAFVMLAISLSTAKEAHFGGRILGGLSFVLSGIFLLMAFRTFHRPPAIAARLCKEKLERRGLLVSTEYEATRAIRIEGVRGSPGYLVELRDGAILGLGGFYLDESEPDGKVGRPRLFPNSRFQVKRRKGREQILDIVCLGEPFEPILTIPAYSIEEVEMAGDIANGEILFSISFDELLASKGRLPKRSGNV